MAKILAVRFSALGDVAMTVAALESFAHCYPDDDITLLSRPFMKPLVENLPPNVHFRAVKLDDYKGLGGLRRLSRELLAEDYDVLIDWHDVLRSKVIRYFFRRAGHKVAVIDKGRKERRMLTRRKNKQLVPLTPVPVRYANTLAAAGFPINLESAKVRKGDNAEVKESTEIGIAPFAAHKGKVWPLPLMKETIDILAEDMHTKIYLFGSGSEEREWCEARESEHSNVVSMVGKGKLSDELCLMGRMDVMVTMDSSNMHLAALAGTKTLSIWGATHPLAGFAGMPVEGSQMMQADLECRPCSIFGNKPCRYGDFHCLTAIKPKDVAERILKIVSP